MAAGTINIYDSAKLYIAGADLDLNSATLMVALISSGYTPALSHSSYATSVDAFELSGWAGATAQALTSIELSDIGSSTIRFDAADIVWTFGISLNVKYFVCYASASSKLLFYVDADTSTTTGLLGKIITLAWPANGIFRIT